MEPFFMSWIVAECANSYRVPNRGPADCPFPLRLDRDLWKKSPDRAAWQMVAAEIAVAGFQAFEDSLSVFTLTSRGGPVNVPFNQ